MATAPDPTISHHAHLSTGNGLVQFVCCRHINEPFSILWNAPDGAWSVNVFHNPQQAYDAVIGHLVRDRENDPITQQVLKAAATRIEPDGDTRPAVAYVAQEMPFVELTEEMR